MKLVSLAATVLIACSASASPVVTHKTVDVDGLKVFYREAGPPNAPHPARADAYRQQEARRIATARRLV